MAISISKSCTENWNAMKSMEHSRFCDRCKCLVHDFSESSVSEIKKKYEENNGKICGRLPGRFLNEQYQNEQLKRNHFHQLKIFFFASLLGFGANLFTIKEAKACSILSGIRSELIESTSDSLNIAFIRGTVKDKENGEVLPFANVALLYKGVVVGGTSTNLDGWYEIKIDPQLYPEVDLQVNYIGYENILIEHIKLKANIYLNIEIKSNPVILGQMMIPVEPLIITDPFRSGKTIDEENYRHMPK
jgi:hypothetical protein